MARFRTRARTVDMLGRQQIAGIPTAISELFKNAHDAYADRAIVDFFRSDRLFVLRDDGVGMTEEDFERRWLTLGTESKAGRGSGLSAPPSRDGYPVRAILGEKGIGRLAIAAIGPQVLLLSRPLRGSSLGSLLVSYMHWGLFELPAADLEDVEIPTIVLAGGTLPTQRDVATLTGWVRENLEQLAKSADHDLVARISADLDDFATLAPDELAEALGKPDLRDGPGTHFYIRPASSMLARGLDEESRDSGALGKFLLGFANTMTPGHAEPAMQTMFLDHYAEDAWRDVIGEGEFFTPDEFSSADHRIVGRIDEYGAFDGQVSVYGEAEAPYSVPWSGARGSATKCGPFHLDIAYVQGRANESRLDPEQFSQVSAKLDRYGGIYVYRDGIRVLPYGNSDVDWLDVELRRNKSASDWFFSYRRMFGAIELTRASNDELREKAGREGFADNDAYRQFRDVLISFLRQVAYDFFREGGPLADHWRDRREELVRLDKARRVREGRIRERRKKLGSDLESFFDRVDQRLPQAEAKDILDGLKGKISTALTLEDVGQAAQAIVDAELIARTCLDTTIRSYEVRRPRGVGLTQSLNRTYSAYDSEYARLQEELFVPTRAEVERLVSDAVDEHRISVNRRFRFDRAVEAVVARATVDTRDTRRDLQAEVSGTRRQAIALSRKGQVAIQASIAATLARAATLDVSLLSEQEFVEARSQIEEELLKKASEELEALDSVTEQLRRVVWPTNGIGPQVTVLDETEAMETELEALRERAEDDLQLTQIGMAVEVVDHEFRKTVLGIRRSLQRIKGWADKNARLREPYEDLRSNFEHLDAYLRLLTPLHRRLYRKKVEISGSQIDRFLRDLFSQRLEDAGIELEATDSFSHLRFMQFPSTMYPVFINLLDNAIWWLTDFRGEKRITLDADDEGMVIRDSGPGVSARDRESVFELGFSRKPGGSGYGLYISREVLGREGLSLELLPTIPDSGAAFRISPISTSEQ